MSRFRLVHVPLVLAAIVRWLVGTKAGRKLLVVGVGLGVGVAALGAVAPNTGSNDAAAKRRDGTWGGLHNEYAPTRGEFAIDGEPGKTGACRVSGRTHSAIGSGWVFRGDAWVAETACPVRIAKDGRVSGRLTLKKEWHGRVKGIGGDDWEERSGRALCEGEIEGTLAAGGKWNGTCPTDDGKKTYASSIAWTLKTD